MSDSYDTMEIQERGSGKSKVSLNAKLYIIGSVIIAIGLAVGLGVGLSNQSAPEPVTEKPDASTTKSTTTLSSESTTATTTESTTTAVSGSTTTTSTTSASTTTTAGPTAPPATNGEPWGEIRLPDTIIPSHYGLTLRPNLDDETFTGENIITMEVKSPTKWVTLHVHPNLNIDSAKLEKADGTEIPITNQFRHIEYQYYIMEVDNDLEVGEYNLTMEFNSLLNLGLTGLYISKYKDEKGVEHKIMSSDMEPSDARRAYPCFDEPAMKIRYTTTIINDEKYYALSNMDDVSNVTDAGLRTTMFSTSVPMPTYLGCFVVCDYGYVENTTKRGTVMRIYAPHDDIVAGRADYANQVSVVIMETFEELLDMNYHLPKCDQISIPDFSSGAMENWGLITYRQTNLLWDSKESSTYYKYRVCAVIAHELAHMWFGNTVTTDWWNSLWLNEGFASYFEYYGLNAAEPDWEIWDQLVTEKESAMRVDSSITSQPIVPPYEEIQTPGQSSGMFTTITYSKGASMLSMLESNIGHDLFIGGLQKYLKDYEFKTAVTQNLWDSMQNYIDSTGNSNYNITAMMDPWIYQNGFPLVTANFDVNNTNFDLTQMQMLSDPDADLSTRDPSPYNYLWPLYVTVSTYNISDGSEYVYVEDNTAVNSSLTGTSTDTAVKLNPYLLDFYRVNYNRDMWNDIVKTLETNLSYFNVKDRSNLVDDAFQLASATKLNYSDALEITNYLDKESEANSYIVWDAYADGSGYMRNMLESTSIYDNFKKYFLTKVKPVADELGWDTSVGTYFEKRNRELTLSLALIYDDVDAKNNATTLFNTWMESDDTIRAEPDVRSLVYRYGVTDGEEGVKQWEYMLQRYVDELLGTEKDALLYGLTQVQNRDLLYRLLEYSKNESIIRTQDFFTCIRRIAYTPMGRDLAWTWYTINWDYLLDRFGADSRQLGGLGPDIVSEYNTESMYWEVDLWFEATPGNEPGEAERVEALKQIRENINWMDANLDEIDAWLEGKLNP